MTNELKEMFSEFIDLCKDEFQKEMEKEITCGAIRLIKNNKQQLDEIIMTIERSGLFSKLIKETRFALTGYRQREDITITDSKIDLGKSDWEKSVRNYFRRSGFYLDLYSSKSFSINSEYEKYFNAFKREEINLTYFLPIEYVSFAENFMDFDHFQIRRFSKEELDEIFQNSINEVFYENAIITTDELIDYWFICFNKKVPARKPGSSFVIEAEFDFCNVYFATTNLPDELLPIIRIISLCECWTPRISETKMEQSSIETGRLRFNIPFIIKRDDNLIASPEKAPDLSILKTELRQWFDDNINDGGVYKSRQEFNIFTQEKNEKFKMDMNLIKSQIAKINIEQERWRFLKISMDFFVKGFFSNGIEQLLWHITSLEALIGRNEKQLKEKIAKRLACIFAENDEGRNELITKFIDLYDIRCDLVHGNKINNNIVLRKLYDVRNLSRLTILRFLDYLSGIQDRGETNLLKRKDIINLLNKRYIRTK